MTFDLFTVTTFYAFSILWVIKYEWWWLGNIFDLTWEYFFYSKQQQQQQQEQEIVSWNPDMSLKKNYRQETNFPINLYQHSKLSIVLLVFFDVTFILLSMIIRAKIVYKNTTEIFKSKNRILLKNVSYNSTDRNI